MVRSGFGIHLSSDSTIYMGNWDNDKMNGSGQIQFSSGAIYEGEFVNNCFHGKGQYTWPNGSRFEGMFDNNRFLLLLYYYVKYWVTTFHRELTISLYWCSFVDHWADSAVCFSCLNNTSHAKCPQSFLWLCHHHLCFIGCFLAESRLAISPQSSSCTCSAREPLEISGTVFMGWIPLLSPNQQCHGIKGNWMH